MKRKAFKELMRQAVGNVLINTELNADALKEKVDPAVLRGVAYGKKCDDIYAESGAVATISKIYGCEVSVDE